MQSWLSKSGVCNPGGGALCSAQAGALKRLAQFYTDKNCKPLAVRGSSGGDLSSCLFVQSFADNGRSIKTLETLWKTVNHRRVHTLIPHIYPRTTGIFKLTPLQKLLEKEVNRDLLINSGIDYKVLASCYGKTAVPEIPPSHKDFYKMVTASAAYPIMFKPVKIDSLYFGDAGLNNNVPINRLISAGCDTIFIVRPYPIRNGKSLLKKDLRIFRLIGRILSEMMETQVNLQMAQIDYINREVELGIAKKAKRKISIIEIAPPHEPDLHVMEFNARKCSKAFDMGYWACDEVIRKIPSI